MGINATIHDNRLAQFLFTTTGYIYNAILPVVCTFAGMAHAMTEDASEGVIEWFFTSVSGSSVWSQHCA